jgi:hypothetical protein
MVNKAVRTALERLWQDRCSIFVYEEVTDPTTHLTDFEEKPLLQDQPCKLSFETLSSTNGDEVATAQQVVKLFLSPDVEVPAGCKIVATRPNDVERTFTYARSGEPGVFSNHQEIMLEPFRRWA